MKSLAASLNDDLKTAILMRRVQGSSVHVKSGSSVHVRRFGRLCTFLLCDFVIVAL